MMFTSLSLSLSEGEEETKTLADLFPEAAHCPSKEQWLIGSSCNSNINSSLHQKHRSGRHAEALKQGAFEHLPTIWPLAYMVVLSS